jgi:hypothetical protein
MRQQTPTAARSRRARRPKSGGDMAKVKTDDQGHAVLKDGLPVWVLDNGSEEVFDGPKLHSTVGKIRQERDEFETQARVTRDALRRFGSSDDEINAAVEKLKLARNLDDKKLIDAGKVDEVVNQRLKDAAVAWEQEKGQMKQAQDDLSSRLRKVLISNRFATTKALDGTFLTPALAEATFGSLFDVENESPVAFRDGSRKERLYSKNDPSKVADFDEALSILVTSHPEYPKWKKGVNAAGGGAPGSGDPAGGNNMTRDQFEAQTPNARMEFIRKGGQVVDTAA